jgi:hypothetical protein
MWKDGGRYVSELHKRLLFIPPWTKSDLFTFYTLTVIFPKTSYFTVHLIRTDASQEQAVMNIMRLVFIPEPNLWIMKDVDIGHDRHNRKHFVAWCVNSGVMD